MREDNGRCSPKRMRIGTRMNETFGGFRFARLQLVLTDRTMLTG
jgi:hypothetical protein